ncbi:unnamed protein product [Coccothraustes coccothraustes]
MMRRAHLPYTKQGNLNYRITESESPGLPAGRRGQERSGEVHGDDGEEMGQLTAPTFPGTHGTEFPGAGQRREPRIFPRAREGAAREGRGAAMQIRPSQPIGGSAGRRGGALRGDERSPRRRGLRGGTGTSGTGTGTGTSGSGATQDRPDCLGVFPKLYDLKGTTGDLEILPDAEVACKEWSLRYFSE